MTTPSLLLPASRLLGRLHEADHVLILGTTSVSPITHQIGNELGAHVVLEVLEPFKVQAGLLGIMDAGTGSSFFQRLYGNPDKIILVLSDVFQEDPLFEGAFYGTLNLLEKKGSLSPWFVFREDV